MPLYWRPTPHIRSSRPSSRRGTDGPHSACATVLGVVGPQVLGLVLRRSAAPADRVDRQRTELIERITIRMVDDHLLDAVELRLLVGVVRFLPGLRALKTDLMGVEDLAQPLPRRSRSAGQGSRRASGPACEAPVTERRPYLRGPLLGCLTMKPSSSVVIRRGRPPAQAGSSESILISLNRWIISRTRSGLV